ncbi:MAG TPA: class I SAM-dependent methyltransferase [Burkholderiales bacterium]
MGVVRGMMELAAAGPADVVYDLGCGDGRIVIEAARRGAKGVCVDVDRARIREARANAREAHLEDRIEFYVDDLFEHPIGDATVVMLFLNADMNLKLRPKLLQELRPATRIVSHMYRIGDWPPAKTATAPGPLRDHPVFLWIR